ncbi:MAG: SpoIIE family protein phosphatase [Spirochaeta sp.]|nr:SpoIIE family protein phosphatase [Spirochaeta sp.]
MLIRERIFWGYIAIIILICLFIVFIFLNSWAIKNNFSNLKDGTIAGVVAMSRIKSRVVEIRAWTTTYIVRGNRVRQGKLLKDALEEQWDDLEEDTSIHLEHESHSSGEDGQAATVMVNLSKKIVSVSVEIVELKDKGSPSEELFEKVRIEFGPLFYPLNQLLDDHLAVHLKELADAEADVQGRLKALARYVPAAGLLIVLLIVFIRIYTDRHLKRYIRERDRAEKAFIGANQEISGLNRRMADELEAAAELQQSLLPKSLSEMSEVDFAWVFNPCEELAGDSFNIFRLDEENLGFYSIDVSGHGVSSALYSFALSKILSPAPDQSPLLKRYDTGGQGYILLSPAEVAEKLNNRFPLDQIEKHYFTLFYGILNKTSLEFRYVSAGHPGFIYHRQNSQPRTVETPGAPIGFVEEPGYIENSMQLQPGDRLYIYSDGITEALNLEDEEYGNKRLLSKIAKMHAFSLKKSVAAVIEDIESWYAGNKQSDDISIIALEIKNLNSKNG